MRGVRRGTKSGWSGWALPFRARWGRSESSKRRTGECLAPRAGKPSESCLAADAGEAALAAKECESAAAAGEEHESAPAAGQHESGEGGIDRPRGEARDEATAA